MMKARPTQSIGWIAAAAVLLAMALTLLLPRATRAAIGGRAEVRQIQVVIPEKGTPMVRFYLQSGPVVDERLDPTELPRYLLMAEVLSNPRGSMFVDLKDDRVVAITVAGGR